MTTDGIVTGLRIYTTVLTVLVAVIGSCQIRRWKTYMPETQLAWLALVFLNLSAFVGTVQTLSGGIPGGTRTYVVAIAVTFELYAVAFPPVRSLFRWRRARRFIRTQNTPKE